MRGFIIWYPLMHDSFESRNELEENLLAAQEGTMQSRVGGGVGISINPDWPVGFDLEPEMVQQLKNN